MNKDVCSEIQSGPGICGVYSFGGGGRNSTGGKVEVRKAGAGSRRVWAKK